MNYTPLYKPKQMILGAGSTVIVTGWSVAKSIAAKLDPSEYAAIGQLYSPARGLSVLVRNLLANPQVRDLVVLCATREDHAAQGCHRLADLWVWGCEVGENDVGTPAWVVRGNPPGYLDIEIPLGWIDRLREKVALHWCDSVAELVEVVDIVADAPVEPWHPHPLTFEIKENLPAIRPGPRYGHRIEGKTVAETWVKIIHRIKSTGTIRPTGYDGHWQELINLVAIVTDEPEGFYFPEPNYLPVDRAAVSSYLPQVLDDAPYQEGVKYTYGQRLRSWFGKDQVQQVIDKLNGEIDAASAVMNLWDVADHEKGGSPCLNHIWLRVVDGELSLTATFRSNDMFSAWPSNAMGLRALQRYIFDRVPEAKTLGPLVTISQSAHIYDDCWPNADSLIKNHHFAGASKKPTFDDPAGDFLISIEVRPPANPADPPNDYTVRVTQTFPAGTECQVWEGRNPTRLMRQIALAVPHLQTGHALYLGGEIQRACHCLSTGIFVQDQG